MFYWCIQCGSGQSGYNSLANARSLTGNNERMGGAFHATLTALAAPITDVLRPTRKQNVIGNARGAGNAESGARPEETAPLEEVESTVLTPSPSLEPKLTTTKPLTLGNCWVGRLCC
jgi:hypothetical protein